MNKIDFISAVNNHLITLIHTEYKPEIKDMFKPEHLEDIYPSLVKCFKESKSKKTELLDCLSNNMKEIIEDFCIHYRTGISDSRKEEILTKNSTKRLDCLDLEELVEKLNCSITCQKIIFK